MPVSSPIAVLLPYWKFWESAGGTSFRQERESLLGEGVAQLATAGAQVVWQGMVDSPEAAKSAAHQIMQAGAQVMVVLQTMAVPPVYAATALDLLEDLPVVIWAAQRPSRLREEFDQYDITAHGATVGTPMLTNVLGRSGRPYQLHAASLQDPDAANRVVRTVQAGAVAGALRRARIARVGRPVEGYACVDVDDEELRRAIGIEVVAVEPAQIVELYQQATDISQLEAEVGQVFHDTTSADPARSRSLRLAQALAQLDSSGGFDAGAMNCHVAQIRYSDDPGITPCFALGRQTSRGVPWTCTGDVITAVAMLVAKRLGGAALYHEIEAIDFTTGEVAIANSGEHDLDWCPPNGQPRLQDNPWFQSDPLTGVCAWFELPPGPATLVGFTPHHAEPSGFRLIAAQGEITSRSFPRSPTVGAAFCFSGKEPVEQVWERWAQAGVNHHSALTPGHRADQVGTVARFLRIGFTQVS